MRRGSLTVGSARRSGSRSIVRLAVIIFLTSHLSLLTCGCSDSRTELERAQEGAMVAAEVYYRLLADDRCEDFLKGKAGADSLPGSYREQLVACYRQFVDQQQRAHQGIRSVQATKAVMDSTARLMQVFMLFSYGDSTREEVVVPMLFSGGQWLMK